MILDKRLIKFNFSKRGNEKVRYIVIHDTGNKRKGAGAINHYKYFNGGNRNASAHYFVDSLGIVQCVEDALSAWHCGDGRGRFGITNRNSIGIEICVNEDGDFDKALDNTLILVRELMAYYNISKSNVVRHYDASRKACPASLMDNNWEKWKIFKEKI